MLGSQEVFVFTSKTQWLTKPTSWVLDRIYFRRGISVLPLGYHFSVLRNKHWPSLFTTI